MILGIDEVGRGPWAGPLVVGAVILGDRIPEGLQDSKKLTEKRRAVLAQQIEESARYVGLGWVHAAELDALGLSEALRIATKRAVENLDVQPTEVIIDGTQNFLDGHALGPIVSTLAKADGLIPSVSAASIIAKVARDSYMHALQEQYPAYAFERHVGYGTALHRQALVAHGVTPEHRKSFAPIRTLLRHDVAKPRPIRAAEMHGKKAEAVVSAWLKSRGWTTLEQNWHHPRYEIDLIVEKDGVIRCIEVKYRATQRDALEVMTPQAVRKRLQAAQMYSAVRCVHVHDVYVVPVYGAEWRIGTPVLLGQSPFN